MDSFWHNIPPQYHNSLRDISVTLNKNREEFLFSEGEPFRGFYVVNTGKFRIFNGNASGQEATLSIMQKGAIISAVPILAHLKSYHADCQAIETSQVVFFPKEKFTALMLENPLLMQAFVKMVSQQFLNIRNKYLSVILKNAEERFLDFLIQSKAHSEYSELKISKKNIASLLDITPESLSRIIKKLENSGKISLKGHKIKIL